MSAAITVQISKATVVPVLTKGETSCVAFRSLLLTSTTTCQVSHDTKSKCYGFSSNIFAASFCIERRAVSSKRSMGMTLPCSGSFTIKNTSTCSPTTRICATNTLALFEIDLTPTKGDSAR